MLAVSVCCAYHVLKRSLRLSFIHDRPCMMMTPVWVRMVHGFVSDLVDVGAVLSVLCVCVFFFLDETAG